jgi:beta-lactamase class A
LLVALYYDAPGVSMDAREAVLREAGTAFVQWATSAT